MFFLIVTAAYPKKIVGCNYVFYIVTAGYSLRYAAVTMFFFSTYSCVSSIDKKLFAECQKKLYICN